MGSRITTDIALSGSVIQAFNNLNLSIRPRIQENEIRPSAMEIIREIINIHTEFTKNEPKNLFHQSIHWDGGAEEEIDVDNDLIPVGEKRSIKEWIHQVTAVYDHDKVTLLHAKLFIIGLCLIDKNTGDMLRSNKLLDLIRDEVKENIYRDLLTENYRKPWRHLFNIYEDEVSTHKDAPTSIDRLGRISIAKFLVNLLYQVRNNMAEKDAFILHIDGAWGSGRARFSFHTKGPRGKSSKRKFPKKLQLFYTRCSGKKTQKSSFLTLIREALQLKAQKENSKTSLTLIREALQLKAQKENSEKTPIILYAML